MGSLLEPRRGTAAKLPEGPCGTSEDFGLQLGRAQAQPSVRIEGAALGHGETSCQVARREHTARLSPGPWEPGEQRKTPGRGAADVDDAAASCQCCATGGHLGKGQGGREELGPGKPTFEPQVDISYTVPLHVLTCWSNSLCFNVRCPCGKG